MSDPVTERHCPWKDHEIYVNKELTRLSDGLDKVDDTLQEVLVAVKVRDNRTKMWVAAIAALGGTAGALIVALLGAI